MHLSKRLKTLVRAVTPGHRVADIGCDHALVPVALVQEGLSPFVIASDINRGPLMRAEENIAAHGLSGAIVTRLGSGLGPIRPEEVDTIICAGMGGALMEEILLAGPEFFAAGKEFILSPHLEWHRIRRLLRSYSYEIEKEWFLKDEGKYYVVIKGVPANNYHLDKGNLVPDFMEDEVRREIDDRYGGFLLRNTDSVLCAFLEEKKEKQSRLLAFLRGRGHSPEIMARVREVEEELFLTDQALNLYKKY